MRQNRSLSKPRSGPDAGLAAYIIDIPESADAAATISPEYMYVRPLITSGQRYSSDSMDRASRAHVQVSEEEAIGMEMAATASSACSPSSIHPTSLLLKPSTRNDASSKDRSESAMRAPL